MPQARIIFTPALDSLFYLRHLRRPAMTLDHYNFGAMTDVQKVVGKAFMKNSTFAVVGASKDQSKVGNKVSLTSVPLIMARIWLTSNVTDTSMVPGQRYSCRPCSSRLSTSGDFTYTSPAHILPLYRRNASWKGLKPSQISLSCPRLPQLRSVS